MSEAIKGQQDFPLPACEGLGTAFEYLSTHDRQSSDSLRIWLCGCGSPLTAYHMLYQCIQQVEAVGLKSHVVFSPGVATEPEDQWPVLSAAQYQVWLAAGLQASCFEEKPNGYWPTAQLKPDFVGLVGHAEVGTRFQLFDMVLLVAAEHLPPLQNYQVQYQVFAVLAEHGLAYLPAKAVPSPLLFGKSSVIRDFYTKLAEPTQITDDSLASADTLWHVVHGHASKLSTQLSVQDGKFRQLSEELEAYNYELEASNEELRMTNDEVTATYQELYKKNIALKHSELLINAVFDTADIGIVVLNDQGDVVRVNNGFVKLLGYSAEDLSAEVLSAIFPDSHMPVLYFMHPGDKARELQFDDELKAICKNGHVIDVRATTAPMWVGDSAPLMVLTLKDVTESKKSRDLLNITLKSLKIAGWEYDLLNKRFSCTREMFELFALANQQQHDSQWLFEMVKGYEDSLFQGAIQQVIGKAEKYDSEAEITVGESQQKWVRITAEPVKNDDGKIVKVYGTLKDITENKLAAERMFRNELLYNTLTQNFPGGTIDLIDKDLRYVFTGGQELEELPQNPDDIIGKSIFEIYPESLANQLYEVCLKVLQGQTLTFDIEHNGKYWIATCTPLSDNDGRVNQIMLLSQNITDRRKADLSLKETHKSLSDFRMALDVASLVVTTNEGGKITYINQNMARLSGFLPEELYGADFRSLLSEKDQAIKAAIGTTIMSGKVWKGELTGVNKFGGTYWVNAAIIPFKDQNGDPYQFLAICSEITEQKLAEEKLKYQNEELTKINAELDRFVYSASHDLRAPLVSILGLLNIARLDSNTATLEGYFDMMEKSVNKLDRFVQEIIDYSRNSRLEVKLETIELGELVHSTFESLKFMEGAEKVKLYVETHALSDFRSDSSRLSIVLSNLISNAINYRSPRREEPWIRVTIEINQQEAVILVSDNGLGISQEYIHRIFDMFFRVSNDSTGSGLGLYIVKETLDVIGGNIQVESKQNIGTRFLIRVPNKVGKS